MRIRVQDATVCARVQPGMGVGPNRAMESHRRLNLAPHANGCQFKPKRHIFERKDTTSNEKAFSI